MTQRDLSQILKTDRNNSFERITLREQTIELLREYITSGRIPPGTRLIEREIADLLGVSRVPVRDALIELGKEGLVVAGSGGRQVIRLTERDIRELYQVRLVLEKLAVELAALNTCPENQAALTTELEAMREAISKHDRSRHVKADVQMHRLIWQQADNEHLLRMLGSMVGPIFMFVHHNAEAFDWNETLALHEELVRCVSEGGVPAAITSIERHLDNALSRSLKALQFAKQTP